MADALDRGRGSFGRHAWADAFTLLSAADRESPLEAEDLERLATAAYLTGRDDDGAEFVADRKTVIGKRVHAHDRYERGEDGRWRIAHTGYVRTYEAMMSLDDLPSFRFTAGVGAPDADAGVR